MLDRRFELVGSGPSTLVEIENDISIKLREATALQVRNSFLDCFLSLISFNFSVGLASNRA